MSEIPTNPETIQEEVFKSWVTSVKLINCTKWGYISEAMPPGAGDVYNLYCDLLQPGKDKHEAQQAAEDFRKLTGYNVEDFYRYLRKLDALEWEKNK